MEATRRYAPDKSRSATGESQEAAAGAFLPQPLLTALGSPETLGYASWDQHGVYLEPRAQA